MTIRIETDILSVSGCVIKLKQEKNVGILNTVVLGQQMNYVILPIVC